MVPTENFVLFAQADKWGTTVRKLLTGEDKPLLYLEWKLWLRFRAVEERLRAQNS